MSEQRLENAGLVGPIYDNSQNYSLIPRQGVEHFRILVIGNANAGKTTILKTVCHAQGRDPVYLDDKGNEVRHAHLQVANAAYSTRYPV
jgi:septin family protein